MEKTNENNNDNMNINNSHICQNHECKENHKDNAEHNKGQENSQITTHSLGDENHPIDPNAEVKFIFYIGNSLYRRTNKSFRKFR
jgi:hypothetical protein